MNKERIEQVARKCGIHSNAYLEITNISFGMLQKFANAIRNEALEDAAIKLSRMEMDLPLDDYVEAIRRMKL